MDPPDELFAMQVFSYSIVYLMALFAFLLRRPLAAAVAAASGAVRTAAGRLSHLRSIRGKP